jgi:hypothetical protein
VVEVLIEGKRLDVFEGFDFSFNYGVADIRNPEKRSTEYSKTIKCPATKNNDALFGHIYDVNISNNYDANTSNIDVNFNPNKKADARVIADGVEVMAGVVQLRKVVQKGHAYTYEVVFIGKLLNIFSVLGDKKLNDVGDNALPLIDFSDLNHDYTYANVVDSWSYNRDYVYPMVDTATNFEYFSDGGRVYRVEDFKPFFKLKNIIDRIFDFAGFTYTSSFLSGSVFSRLITGDIKESTLSDAQVELRNALVNIGGNYDLLSNAQTTIGTGWAGGRVHRFLYDSVVYDVGNNFDVPLEIYISNYQTMATVYSVVSYVVKRTKRTFYSITGSGSQMRWWRYDILFTGLCNVYERLNGVWTLDSSNESTSQTLYDLTLDAEQSFNAYSLSGLILAVTTDESFRDTAMNTYGRFFGFDCLYGSLSAPTFNHSIRMYSDQNGYETLSDSDFVLYPNMGLNESVNQSSTSTAEGVHIYNSNYLFTELFIPKELSPSISDEWNEILFENILDEYSMIPTGFFKVEVESNAVLEQMELDFNSIIPTVGMKDLLTSVFKMFNLYVEVDPNNESNLLIETRDDFYKAGGTKDWTYKLARDRDIALEPLGVLTDREYIYTYKEDGDYYNQRYQNNRGHAYGRQRIEVDNDFVQSTKEVSVIFSPTPLVNDNPSNRIIPKIYDADIEDGYKPTKANIRVLYYGGLLPSNPTWDFIGMQDAPLNQPSNAIWTAQSTYPYAGHWDNPLTPTLDINFGLILEMYYQTNGYTGQLQVINAGLYNVYHRNYINEITDKDSKVMTAMFYIEPTDINTLDFRDQIVIDNAYWRLNKVMNYNPFKEGLTKVELIKIKEPVTFQKKSKKLNLGGLIGKERMPNSSTEIRTNGNKYPPFQGKVNGRDNSVGYSVSAFNIVGSNNTIGEGSRNVVILGDRNEVVGGLHNVQLINTNGVIVSESNTTFINGKQQENRDVLDGSKDSVRALDGGTNVFTVDGGEDIVQKQFSDNAIYIVEGGQD